ncbi:IS30 family transposase [Novosphingobium sp. CECT 9465]|uniref:IS30 family transposase n=1 Tax=Novosphingobium sp. CECT 9465 TaxID=2829794 RepID=UPI001E5F0B3C|nr:IS30 family transposase [Novosphingobium sp. CECT 9465]CAH0496707.1 IS30 family transposase ISRssp4 [Novosphingobium sp. CECT 9465]
MSRSYHQLDLDERELIFRMRDARTPVRQIAARLGRHVSTIYRELKRNFFYDEDAWFRGYFPRVAHRIARSRRMCGGKIARNAVLATSIAEGLRLAWSPEQIAGHARMADGDAKVCHETIYQYVYSPEGRRQDLWRHLPRARKNRRRRYARKPRGLNIPLANTIAERPVEIGSRASYGHWEGDLVAFRKEFGKANLTSLVERRSRFIVLIRNPSRHSSGVMTGIERCLRPLPPALRRSITFDRGTEFSGYRALKTSLGVDAYFCKPSAPWQKGSVENGNGRLRRFLPLDTDLAEIPDSHLQSVADRLNRTPRKCLGYRTPLDVLTEEIIRAG